MARQFNLGRLSTILSLNATDFRAGLSGSDKQVRNFRRSLILLDREMRDVNRRVRTFTSSFLNIRSAIAGVAALGGLGFFVREAASAGTQLEELSIATGISARELDRLTRAFEADGVAAMQSQLAVRNFARRVGEARQGMGTYIRALEAAGITQQQLFSQDIGPLLRQFIAGLQGIEDGADRAAIAAQFFERAGLQLLTVLARSPEEFDRMIRRAELFGVRTNEVTAELKDLDQSFTDIAQASETALAAIVAGFGGGLSDVITGVALSIAEVETNFQNLNSTLRIAITLASVLVSVLLFRGVAAGIGRIIAPVARLVTAFRNAQVAARAAGTGVSGFFRGLLAGGGTAATAAAGTAATLLGINQGLDAARGLFNELAELQAAGAAVDDPLNQTAAAAAALAASAELGRREVEGFRRELDLLQRDAGQGCAHGVRRSDHRVGAGDGAGAARPHPDRSGACGRPGRGSDTGFLGPAA